VAIPPKNHGESETEVFEIGRENGERAEESNKWKEILYESWMKFCLTWTKRKVVVWW